MLSSVFNRRKVQKRLNNLTTIRRNPSPESFTSHDANEKAFVHHHEPDINPTGSSNQITSPKVQLDLPYNSRRDTISDWFPPDLLQVPKGSMSPPERNVSLGNLGLNASTSTSSSSSLGNASKTGVENASREAFSFSLDDVIVIEAPRGRDPTPSPLRDSPTDPFPSREQSVSGNRKPAPTPLKIPPNHKAAQFEVDASLSALPNPHSAVVPSSHSRTRSLSPIQTSHPRSQSRSSYRSRASSFDGSSAISGTTIARALVQSYILSPTASIPQMSTSGKRAGQLVRQDSATLPHGFLNRSSFWRDRRISGGEIIIMSPEEKEKWGTDNVPPVPALPEGIMVSAAPSASVSRRDSHVSPIGAGHRSRRSSIEVLARDGSRRNSKRLTLDLPEVGSKRINRMSEVSIVVSSNRFSNTDNRLGSLENNLQKESTNVKKSQESSKSKSSTSKRTGIPPDAPTTATSTSYSVSSYDTRNTYGFIFSPDESSGTSSMGVSSIMFSPRMSIISPDSVGSLGSVLSPGSSADVHSPLLKRSASDSRRKMSRPHVSILPIGERPQSVGAVSPTLQSRGVDNVSTRPHSMSPLLPPPPILASSNQSPEDSPDLLDMMFGTPMIPPPSNTSSGPSTGFSSRLVSPPAPISVPAPDSFSFSEPSPTEGSSVRQTFPETPYAFTPLVSAGFSPGLPLVPKRPGLQRNGTQAPSTRREGPPSARLNGGMGKRALMRSASMGVPNSPPISSLPPIPSPVIKKQDTVEENDGQLPSAGLSVIEEGSLPSTPQSVPSAVTSPAIATTPATSPQSQESSKTDGSFSPLGPRISLTLSEESTDEIPMERTSSALPSPPISPKSIASAYSTSTSDTHGPQHSPESVTHSLSSHDSDDRVSSIFGDESFSQRRPSMISSDTSVSTSGAAVEAASSKRLPRSRPPPPSGPRRPSGASMLFATTRARNGSVSSSKAPSRNPSMVASTIRFQSQPVKYRGLTMEAAQWTLTSHQLQEIVSKAIKGSADASVIRLLPLDLLNEEVPAEVSRLEAQSAELKTSYKVAVRKRKMLLASLGPASEAAVHEGDNSVVLRIVDELSELSDHLDHISEELYTVTDQLKQLKHILDRHASSALAMALRKLNTSFLKYLQDNQALRQQVAALEAEKDTAWRHAQETAEELDEINERMNPTEGSSSGVNSRRSSRIMISRKASLRASKAGLIHARRKSHRISIASTMSPSTRTGGDVPPVPPLPLRTPLGILTSGLTPYSASLTIDSAPASEVRAMVQAQKELCEMLGISIDDVQGSQSNLRPRSMSAVLSPSVRSPPVTAASFRSRRNSDVGSPGFRTADHRRPYRSRSIDDIQRTTTALASK